MAIVIVKKTHKFYTCQLHPDSFQHVFSVKLLDFTLWFFSSLLWGYIENIVYKLLFPHDVHELQYFISSVIQLISKKIVDTIVDGDDLCRVTEVHWAFVSLRGSTSVLRWPSQANVKPMEVFFTNFTFAFQCF